MNGDGAVTAYDAHLFLNLLQEATILVPANGKAEVVCHIRLLDRSALNTSYPTGAYVEGYVRVQGLATDEGAAGHEPFHPGARLLRKLVGAVDV